MTKTSGQKKGARGLMLAALQNELDELAEELGETLLGLRQQEKGGLAAFKEKAEKLREMIVGYNQERAKIDKVLYAEGGDRGGGSGELDLAAARVAVERGLARLAAARGAEAVSD